MAAQSAAERGSDGAVREFHLEEDLDRGPSELTYGRRRLVAIARAVAMNRSILLLDEPAVGLGETETGRLLRRVANGWGIGILLIEHEMNLVMATCERVVLLEFGRKIADGVPADVRADPAVVAEYLGETNASELVPAGVEDG